MILCISRATNPLRSQIPPYAAPFSTLTPHNCLMPFEVPVKKVINMCLTGCLQAILWAPLHYNVMRIVSISDGRSVVMQLVYLHRLSKPEISIGGLLVRAWGSWPVPDSAAGQSTTK